MVESVRQIFFHLALTCSWHDWRLVNRLLWSTSSDYSMLRHLVKTCVYAALPSAFGPKIIPLRESYFIKARHIPLFIAQQY